MKLVLSPRELSEAIGVSESSVKRWVDRGVIVASRTAGGHRRISIDEAIRFIRATRRELPRPELLGLALHPGAAGDSWDDAFAEALECGDAPLARSLIWSMHLQGMSAAAICDGRGLQRGKRRASRPAGPRRA